MRAALDCAPRYLINRKWQFRLREEGAALRQLAAEKGSYFNKASSHPKYTEAWNKFWIAKQKKVGNRNYVRGELTSAIGSHFFSCVNVV